MTIVKNILKFIEVLKYQDLKVPDGFEILNPFMGKDRNKINEIAKIFYNKYYNDNNSRYIILGSFSGKILCGVGSPYPIPNVNRSLIK